MSDTSKKTQELNTIIPDDAGAEPSSEGAAVNVATRDGNSVSPVTDAAAVQENAASEEGFAPRKKGIFYAFAAAVVLLGLMGGVAGTAFGWFASSNPLLQTTQEALETSSSEKEASDKNKDDAGSQEFETDASDETDAAHDPKAQSAEDVASGEASGKGTENTAAAEPPSPPSPVPEPAPPAPATITVSVFVDSSEAVGHGWSSSLASATVTLAQGASVYDALCATGVSVGGSSAYVSSISGLAEFACGSRSGWLYYVNGVSPGYSCGSYILQGGESITWHYVLEG